jgi:hypothetical protein
VCTSSVTYCCFRIYRETLSFRAAKTRGELLGENLVRLIQNKIMKPFVSLR